MQKNNRPLKMINMGIGLIPEDRMAHGLIGVSSFAHNITLSSLFRFIKGIHLNLKKEKKIALEFKRKFKIQTPTIDTKIIYLSGGNQQKVCLSKWLCSDSDILIFDEPTKGIDIQTKYEIHSLISSLAKDGKAIIMISSEIKEILGMSDTILVMRQGEIMGIFDRKEANDEVILTKAIVANSTATC